MKQLASTAPKRHKAVWGPKRILAAAAVIIVGLAPNAVAAGRHHAGEGQKAAPGRPNSNVKPYRLDNELSLRAARNHATNKTKVVVELMPGAKLPQKYVQY